MGEEMNHVVLLGRLTRDPDIKYSQNGSEPLCIARYTLAVSRWHGQDQGADFISCVAFGRAGEFVERYLKKGAKICVSGRIQTGSYTNKDGVKVYTTAVVAEQQEFAESRRDTEDDHGQQAQGPSAGNEFVPVPDYMQEELPFA